MRSDIVFPFRTLVDSSPGVVMGKWYSIGQKGTENSFIDPIKGIEGWSYNSPVTFVREFEVECQTVKEQLDLRDSEAKFSILVLGEIGDIGNRRVVKKVEIPDVDCFDHSIEITLDSRLICQYVKLITSLVLSCDLEDVPAWSPSQSGSRLWEDQITIPLEGSKGRFPIRDVDFTEDFRISDAADWHLDWNPRLTHYSFNSAVTLLINSSKPDFIQRLQDEDEIVGRTLMSDVVYEISTCLLMSGDFVDPVEPFPEGSLGQVVSTWFELAFPGASLVEIRQQYKLKPNMVSTAIRSVGARL